MHVDSVHGDVCLVSWVKVDVCMINGHIRLIKLSLISPATCASHVYQLLHYIKNMGKYCFVIEGLHDWPMSIIRIT